MKAGATIEAALKEGRRFLLEYEAEGILAEYGLDVAPAVLAEKPEDGLAFASESGWPVVLKIMSPQIIHKSDAGGVKVGISGEEDFIRAWKEIISKAREYDAGAEIKGILVQKMIPSGREVIIGTSRDPQFGPIVMFGLGGVFVEVFKDVVFRAAPVDEREAARMIEEIRSVVLLKGFRGEPPSNLTALARAISRISRLAAEHPRIAELDANPLRVGSEKAWVVDARIILAEEEA